MTLQLLHVDDDECDRLLVGRAVQHSRLPIQLQAVSGGGEALQLFESSACLPDLILLDIRMPMMSGFEFLEILKRRESLRQISVVMFSNSSDPNDISRGRTLGAHSYCIKPTKIEELAAFIQTLYESWLRSEIPCHWPARDAVGATLKQ